MLITTQRNMKKRNKKLSPEARALLAKWGRKGGLAGSREAKSRAGKKGYVAMLEKALGEQKTEESK